MLASEIYFLLTDTMLRGLSDIGNPAHFTHRPSIEDGCRHTQRFSCAGKYMINTACLILSLDYELMLRLFLKHSIKSEYIPKILTHMRIGGASNVSLAARIRANRMDRKAWAVNQLRPYPWTTLLKPLRKAGQWWMRPAA